jgi:hypothetical protein
MKTGEAVKSPLAGLRAAAIIKLNAAFLAFFFLLYMALLLQPKYSHILDRGAASLVRCTFRDACPTSTQHLTRKVRYVSPAHRPPPTVYYVWCHAIRRH